MSINRYGDEIIFSCDVCDETEHTGTDDFTEALAYAKEYGWKMIRVNEDWHHFCGPNCEVDFKSEELDELFETEK